MDRKMDLCVPCAEKMKDGYILKLTDSGRNRKITCALCGRRRYGSGYIVESGKLTVKS